MQGGEGGKVSRSRLATAKQSDYCIRQATTVHHVYTCIEKHLGTVGTVYGWGTGGPWPPPRLPLVIKVYIHVHPPLIVSNKSGHQPHPPKLAKKQTTYSRLSNGAPLPYPPLPEKLGAPMLWPYKVICLGNRNNV